MLLQSWSWQRGASITAPSFPRHILEPAVPAVGRADTDLLRKAYRRKKYIFQTEQKSKSFFMLSNTNLISSSHGTDSFLRHHPCIKKGFCNIRESPLVDKHTCPPVPSGPLCLSPEAGLGHLRVTFQFDDICNAPDSEPPTSGSAAAATLSLTLQRSPCHFHKDTTFLLTQLKMTVVH